MVDTRAFLDAMEKGGVRFFSGVPDSLLKAFCACLAEHALPGQHVTAANEGGAVALAAGHYLASGQPALVYMQNSGQGNALNPLLSLADPEVYGIPMLLLIGWRGEPGRKDEPQHVKQGAVTIPLCDTIDLPCHLLPEETDDAIHCLREALQQTLREKRPVALVARAGLFSSCPMPPLSSPYTLSREQAIAQIASNLPGSAALVATTGKISRELYEYRISHGEDHEHDFLVVGSMGHASHIALGMAIEQPTRPIVCLDGDGALLMHLGALAICGVSKATNLLHVVLNNGTHDSVGGQPTVGFDVDFARMALACGYRDAQCIRTEQALLDYLQPFPFGAGPRFLEIRVAGGSRDDLGRPRTTPRENKRAFMHFLQRACPARDPGKK